MHADVTHLLNVGPLSVDAETWRKAWASLPEMPADIAYGAGPCSGFIELTGRSNDLTWRIDGKYIESLEIGPKGARVRLHIPSPVPGYRQVDKIALDLKFDPVELRWEVLWDVDKNSDRRWFEKDASIRGILGNWLRQNDKGIQMPLFVGNSQSRHPGGFPLNVLGIASNSIWVRANTVGAKSDHALHAGLLRGSDGGRDYGSATLVLVPYSTPPGKDNVNVEWDKQALSDGLQLRGLEHVTYAVHSDHSWPALPLTLGYRLHGAGAGTWRAVVQWRPCLDVKNSFRYTQLHSLRARRLLEIAWNEPVRKALVGAKLERSAQPLVSLPVFEFDGLEAAYPPGDSDDRVRRAEQLDDQIQPVLVFDFAKPGQPRLRHIHLVRQTLFPIRAHFPWSAESTCATAMQQGSLVFEGKVTSIAKLPWAGPPEEDSYLHQNERDWLLQFENACRPLDEEEDHTVLMRWTATGRVRLDAGARNSGTAGSLVWGSLAIEPVWQARPDPSGAKAKDPAEPPTVRAVLTCILRGEWTRERCDLYPEISLEFGGLTNEDDQHVAEVESHTIKGTKVQFDPVCQVRLSEATDSAGQALDAALDGTDPAEDALQRNAQPLRLSLAGASQRGRNCKVYLRHKSEAGRNAVTRVDVHSDSLGTLGEASVILQPRPFFVAQVQPSDLDPEGGTLIASWASNDPEGAQWRVPDSTLSLAMQPQTVGEAMERGARFWRVDGDYPAKQLSDHPFPAMPWIDPRNVIAYRFSPPTALTIRPSLKERRYNTSPGNVAAALAGARVESFTTEMVYPVEVRFHVSGEGLPHVRIAELAADLGRPPENLPPLPSPADVDKNAPFARWLRLAYSSDAQDYAITLSGDKAFLKSVTHLRFAQAAAKADFTARLAVHRLFNPYAQNGALDLQEGLAFRIRGTTAGAPPLLNPLPQFQVDLTKTPPTINKSGTDLTVTQKQDIQGFLGVGQTNFGAGPDSIPAGVVHTMEFPSELVAVLRDPRSTRGRIDSLAFSALGATGQMSAAFDEGRTIFIAETSYGQLSRLIKVRIGRLGVLWNRAKHIIVYERTTVASLQFEPEQHLGFADASPIGEMESYGWPILRKTEEYVEPIEFVREFSTETDKDDNRSGFVAASEVVTPRIYVNGAWGRDLGHGYEIPLWDPNDASGFYPKPQLALLAQSGGGARSRCWLDEPEHLVFYSNTQKGTRDNPDKWLAKPGVDCPEALHRLPLADCEVSRDTVKPGMRMPVPRMNATRRPRFDFAVRSAGKVDLQHGRGQTQMLAGLDVVALSRTAESARADLDAGTKKGLDELQALAKTAATLDAGASLSTRVEAAIARAVGQLARAPGYCKSIKDKLHVEVADLFSEARKDLLKGAQGLTKLPTGLPSRVLAPAIDELDASLKNQAPALFEPLLQVQRVVQAMLDRGLAGYPAPADKVAAARAQIAGAAELARAAVAAHKAQLLMLVERIRIADSLNPVATILGELIANAGKAAPDLPLAKRQCEIAQEQLRGLAKSAVVGGVARHLQPCLALAAQCLESAASLKTLVAATNGNVLGCVDTVIRALGNSTKGIVLQIDALAKAIEITVANVATTANDKLTDILAGVPGASLEASLAEAVAGITTLVDRLKAEWSEAVGDATQALQTAAKPIDAQLFAVVDGMSVFAQTGIESVIDADNTAKGWLAGEETKVLAVVDAINCAAFDAFVDDIRSKIAAMERRVREELTESASKLLDSQTQSQLKKLEEDVKAKAPQLIGQASQAIKLVKAMGELPALPTLSFNADRVEYLFDDLRKQIDTSPFAAKLRDIDTGLKELGIVVPTNQLLDQFVPSGLKDLKFEDIFKNIGALDFKDLFERFRLPDLDSRNIAITQSVDKASQSAQVSVRVNADFPESNTLFSFAGLAVTVAAMQIRAASDTRVTRDGQTSTTDARLTGDWGLVFSGASLAKFRQVTVRYDGSGFKFDMDPKKVELNPSLKFFQEWAAQFKPELPPAIQIDYDGRGVPVGALASMITDVVLPPLGAVEIGPVRIESGLNLRMGEDAQFVIGAHLSIGSRGSPVWVQIGYLGGGFWLEARATHASTVKYSASVGLAVGCIKSATVAGVASGRLALLFFAYAQISEMGGSFRVGFSLEGSARILGICNAGISLLLQIENKGGETQGRGVLDVSVDICWCYTLHVCREEQRKIA